MKTFKLPKINPNYQIDFFSEEEFILFKYNLSDLLIIYEDNMFKKYEYVGEVEII